MFITYGKGGKIFSSDFSPFWLWFSKKDLTIIKVLEIVNFTPFFRLFCLVTKENGKNWDHWWHSLTHIFVYSQGTVLICQGNTFRCGR